MFPSTFVIEEGGQALSIQGHAQLLRYILMRGTIDAQRAGLTKALLILARDENAEVKTALLDAAADAIDEYLTPDAEDSAFKEPSFINTHNSDLNAFLKAEKFPKNEETCPRLKSLLNGHEKALGKKQGSALSLRDAVIAAVKKG